MLRSETNSSLENDNATPNPTSKSAKPLGGLKWFVGGMLCMAVSFLLTFFLENPQLSVQLMYALTSIGIVLISKGLYELFGL